MIDDRSSRIKSLIFNLSMDKMAVPVNVKTYYRYAEFFFNHTAVGTVILKKARFLIQNLRVSCNDANVEAEAKKTIRKINLKEKLVKAGRNYDLYGRSVAFPMDAIKKTIICRACGKVYYLSDLIKNGRKMYEWSTEGDGTIRYKCRNKECGHKGQLREFKIKDVRDDDVNNMSIAIWSPNNITCIYNKITDTKTYKLYIDNEMRNYILKGEHDILEATPQIYIKAAIRNERLKVNKDRLFVFETPTMEIKGTPIPPMVAAFQDLYTRMQFLSANQSIAEEMMVPFRMIYPIFRGESGATPVARSFKFSRWSDETRKEYAKYKKDNSHVMFMPIEMGSKDFWGNGRLLVLGSELRSNMQDILATMGYPIEFLYGGVTWSRQNVGAIILANSFKQFASIAQELLDFIADKINKKHNIKDNVTLTIATPRLVEGLAESSLIERGLDRGEVSPETYWNRFNIDLKEERGKIEATKQDSIYFEKLKRRKLAIGEVESQEILLSGQKTIKEIERKEALKDQIVATLVEEDRLARTVKNQKELAEIQTRQQKELIRYQMGLSNKKVEKDMSDQLDHLKKTLKIQSKQSMIDAKKQQKLELKHQENMMLQGDAVNRKRSKIEKEEYLKGIFEQLPTTEQLSLTAMGEVKKMEALRSIAQQQENESTYEGLNIQEKQEIDQLPEEEKEVKLREISEKNQSGIEDDPSLKKEQLKEESAKRQEEDEVEISASTYNRLSPEERERFKGELMQESSIKFAKVKEMADSMAIVLYADELEEADDRRVEEIITKIKSERPDILDEVELELEKRMFIQQQAGLYAARLLQLEGTPGYDKLVEEISQSPDNFKEMVFDKAQEYAKIKSDNNKTKVGDNSDEHVAKEMAMEIKNGYNKEDRAQMLKQLKYQNPDLYKKIIVHIG